MLLMPGDRNGARERVSLKKVCFEPGADHRTLVWYCELTRKKAAQIIGDLACRFLE